MPAIDVLLHGWRWRTDQGRPGLCGIILINGQQRILVDVWHVGRRTFLLDTLAQRGLTPSDIDITIMTHAHWDHNQNFDLFPDAPMLAHKLERKYAHKPHTTMTGLPYNGLEPCDRPPSQHSRGV